MRVLVISQAFPYPPFDGNLLPIYHFLRCLAPRVEYALLTLRPAPADPTADDRWREGVRIFESWGMRVIGVEAPRRAKAAQTLACLAHGRPWPNRFFSPELAARAAELLNSPATRPDVIHAEGILSAQHAPRRLPCGGVLIARDCLSLAHWRAWLHTRRPKEFLQYFKIRSMESALYGRFHRILAISPTDRDAMARIRPGAPLGLLPNGVDLEQFKPAPGREEPERVAFSGAMDFPPNVDGALWLAREVWPLVLKERPNARLMLVGRDPVEEIRRLSATEPSIEVTGRVAAIEEHLIRAAVIVSPLRLGTGMKNKVLEGAALGKAMVVTPVSLEDIDLAPGRELLLAESAQAMASAIVELLGDKAKRERLGEAARRGAVSRYAWEAMAGRLWDCYQALAQPSFNSF